MRTEEIVFKGFEEIPLNLIDIAEENVRKTKQKAGLEELKASIEKIGLIQPVVVIPDNGRFKLIVGQRRYLAFTELGKEKIPSLIISPSKLFLYYSHHRKKSIYM